jgi:hypothetical protein
METTFKLPDPKKKAGVATGILLIGGLGLIAYYYILPFLIAIAWGTVQLGIATVISAVLLMILTSKKFWRRLDIILGMLGEIIFGFFVDMNPFVILMMQLDKTEEDRRALLEQNQKLQGQASKLETQLTEQHQEMKVAAQEMEICKKKIATNPGDEDAPLQLETAVTNFTNSKDFIDSVEPIYNDIQKLVVFTDKAYRKSGNSLKNAKNTVMMQKTKYEAVTEGSSAMKKALRAFTGDPEMNKAGAMALDKLRVDIANKIGTIRTTIKATSDIMNEKDLRDAAKVNLAVQTVENLNIDATFEYLPEGKQDITLPAGNNKYLQYLK